VPEEFSCRPELIVTTTRPARHPLTVTSTLLTLLTVALWGGNPVATRFAVEELPPVTVSGLRFLLATLVMIVWCRLEGASFRLTTGQWRPVVIAGVLLYLQILTFTVGAAWTSSSHASLYVNTFVFWVIGVEHFVTHTDRLNGQRFLGVLVAALGVFALLLLTAEGHTSQQQDKPSVNGDVLLIFSAFLLAVKFVYTKFALKTVGATELILWHDVVAVALFFVTAAALETPVFHAVSWPAWWGLLYQGILVGGVCFALQAHLLKRHSASQIAIFSFATPLFGLILGIWLRGDRMSSGLILASIAVAMGIWLVNRPARAAKLSTKA